MDLIFFVAQTFFEGVHHFIVGGPTIFLGFRKTVMYAVQYYFGVGVLIFFNFFVFCLRGFNNFFCWGVRKIILG